MACRTGCSAPGTHATWGECARAADIQIDRHGLKGYRGLERDKDRRLNAYADLRSEGLQPRSTTWKDVRETYETGGTKPTEVTQGGTDSGPTD